MWREVGWVVCHAVPGFALGLVALTLPLSAVRDISFPLWWRLVPAGDPAWSPEWWAVHDLPDALGIALVGVGWLVVAVVILPGLAWLQALPGRRLLSPGPGADLALRVAQLTATRAAALDAHAAELREVIRGVLPPVLAERSLADALAGLASACPVPCRVDADVPGRCTVSVEATAYFVVAEALTNVAKHSGAEHAVVVLRRPDDRLVVEVTDDGHGGADERTGSGLVGIRGRVEAHDGTFALSSPAGGPTTLEVSLPCGS